MNNWWFMILLGVFPVPIYISPTNHHVCWLKPFLLIEGHWQHDGCTWYLFECLSLLYIISSIQDCTCVYHISYNYHVSYIIHHTSSYHISSYHISSYHISSYHISSYLYLWNTSCNPADLRNSPVTRRTSHRFAKMSPWRLGMPLDTPKIWRVLLEDAGFVGFVWKYSETWQDGAWSIGIWCPKLVSIVPDPKIHHLIACSRALWVGKYHLAGVLYLVIPCNTRDLPCVVSSWTHRMLYTEIPPVSSTIWRTFWCLGLAERNRKTKPGAFLNWFPFKRPVDEMGYPFLVKTDPLVPKMTWIPSTIPRCSDVAFSFGCLGCRNRVILRLPWGFIASRRIDWKRNSNIKKTNLYIYI